MATASCSPMGRVLIRKIAGPSPPTFAPCSSATTPRFPTCLHRNALTWSRRNEFQISNFRFQIAKAPPMNDQLSSRLDRIQLVALVTGLLALGVSAVGAFTDRQQFLFSYLFA